MYRDSRCESWVRNMQALGGTIRPPVVKRFNAGHLRGSVERMEKRETEEGEKKMRVITGVRNISM
jgi:hypothetical protein